MKKCWSWLFLSGIWILISLHNIIVRRSSVAIAYCILASVLFAGLSLVQYICEKRNKKKLFKYIYVFVGVALVVYPIIILAFL